MHINLRTPRFSLALALLARHIDSGIGPRTYRPCSSPSATALSFGAQLRRESSNA